MLVHDWMTAHPTTTTPETRISAVAAMMLRSSIRHLPVVRPNAEGLVLVGIVSSYDVARAYPPQLNPWSLSGLPVDLDHPVSEIMTKHPVTVEATTPIERAAGEMAMRRIHALPVVRAQHVVGILTEADVTRAFVAILGPREKGVRITFVCGEREDLFGTVLALAAKHQAEVTSLLTVRHEGRRLALVHVSGPRSGAFLDAVWKSGHRVESVVHDDPLAA